MTSTDLALVGDHSLPDKIEFAKALAGSSLIPNVYRQHPANVLVAIELGNALGIAPIVAINEINVINGTPAPSASLMAALARQAGHKVRVSGDKQTATCTIVRADDPDWPIEVTWDEQKARDSGLWGKGHWQKDPAVMLKWRAISECVRLACSEVLGGLKYTPEEVSEMTAPAAPHIFTRIEPPEAPAARPPSIQDAIAERQAVEAAWEPAPEPEQEDRARELAAHTPDAYRDLRTDAQSKKLYALMRERGLNDRADALAYCSAAAGREVESTRELTVHEASLVIDALAGGVVFGELVEQ